MRILVNLLLDTLPMLGNVLLLCFFVFFIFGIIGVQLWAGLLRNRCYPEENFTLSTGVALPAPYYSPDEEDEKPFICSLPQDNGIMACSDVPARRVAGHQCCLDVDDLLHHQALGLVTEPFLNASAAVPGLCVNWNRYYTRCHTGHRNPHKGAINFDNIGYAWIVIFQVGSFFMINLCLVVIATQFSETKQREHQLMQEQRAACLSSSTLAEPGDCYEEIFQLVCHVLRKARRRTAAFFRTLCCKPPEQIHEKTNINGGEKSLQQHDGATPAASAANQQTEEDAAEETDRCQRAEGVCQRQSRELWMEIRVKLWGIVESKYFNRGIMVAILINTISMGIEHHEQPEELTNVLEICNIVFTSMFALEMILKLTAFGCFNYLRNPYNIFDGIIVIIRSAFTNERPNRSVCEIVGQSDGGLSVLRTFRLLRVLKLVRFMPALRRQLVVLMKTMDNVATFCMLLMLFIFIFSILGMHIFGCKFSLKTDTGDTVPDRKNFDSLLWAIILTQEDWNVVLYNGMASTSPLAALYFVALMTFGNYVLFNLLVAILVEGFQAEGDANRSYSDDDEGSSSNGSEQHKNSLTFSDPKLPSLTPNGHLDLAPLAEEKTRPGFSEENHQSRTISLGRRSSSLRHSRSSHYHHWGRPPPQPSWSRRCSWNSAGRSARGLRAGGVIGGSLRVRSVHSHPAEHESLLPHPPFLSHRHRRALSLELPELLQRPPLVRKKSVSAEHQDCNGKGPGPQGPLLGEVYPQLNARKDKNDLEEDNEYSLCFRIQKMMEVYRPDWCEKREDWSIYLFSPQNKFRLLCQTIIAHKLFDYVVLAFIFLNCITVALERPRIHQGSLERVFLTISNYVFTAIFVAEMTVKPADLCLCLCVSQVVSMGLYLGDRAYLRSSWNVLDGFLVFVSLIDIVVSMAGGAKILGVLRVLRLLRTLRPLRVISRAPGLKLVVETLITSLKPIGNIVLICCAFFIIFGILGVQLFKGKFYYCVGLDVKNITNKSDCLSANYRWVHHKYNFDNLGQALMSLFVLASKDGWVNIMYHGLDAVGIDQQPVVNNNPWMLLYFISFLLIVSFFVLNMFVGVVVENFHKCRQHQEVEEARRREEKRLKRMEKRRRKAQRLPYYSSYGRVRLMIHSFCTSHYLDLFITLIICINVITMSLEHYNQPQSLETALKYCNYFFSSTFVVEATLKLIAFGFRRFFKDRWNQLDLAIVLLSVMGITLEEIEINASLPINPTIIRIMRVLRIARVLKLLKMATGMRALLDTVVQALPQVNTHTHKQISVSAQQFSPKVVGNLGLLFILLFFIYAALGVELFGELVCNVEYPCEGMSRHATFENFGMAFLTLFQVSTGDNWNGIMKDTLRECPPGDNYSCNASLQIISPMYFVSFVLTAQFVLINVVVAVLMKHLDDSNKEAQEDAEMDAEIEMELAQGGLCCLGRLDRLTGADGGEKPAGGCGNKQAAMAAVHTHNSASQSGFTPRRSTKDTQNPRKLYSPAQENQWLESVSLLMKDSLDGEMQMIDNLSGSVFHHYCSPPIRRDGRSQSGEIRLAEVEQTSLMSEQLSDKSSSPALPDDISLDEHSDYQLLDRDCKEEQGSADLSTDEVVCRRFLPPSEVSSPRQDRRDVRRETGLQLWSPAHCGDGSGGEGQTSSPLFHLPPEFFHPTTAAIPQGSPATAAPQPGSRHTSPASWASLRSPGANTRVMGSQPSQSNSSLATGSSASSLQTMPEEGVPQPGDLTLPLICRTHAPPPELSQRSRTPQTLFNLQATRGRQRNRSRYSDCTNPNLVRQDPSDEDTGSGIRAGGAALPAGQVGNPEQLSDNLSSFSLTSLHPPDSLAPPLAKKCNSTGSLVQGSLAVRNKDGRCLYGFDPWTEATSEETERDASPVDAKTCSQTVGSSCRKNR
ncbi:voltage-dependent T-type calcium channel subunit alpha-1I-like protein [Labeo rohita]|uniref:Voltage-dependent T-type calcium channel subunit alpha-1I-like protein n=1 Tax=Labeo rohita TaxID=84645 RepID=A0A498NL27_LABRO|nr:voltage-dependent T-type calcium channel subunit alpha-1I-like protein [Labeo rohita]